MYEPPHSPAGQPRFPPPAVDPSLLRPRRVWYVIAALIAVVLTGAGVAVFIFGIVTATGTGSIDQRFGSGETVTIKLDAQAHKAVYARIPYRSGGYGSDPVATPPTQCTVTDPSGRQLALDTPTGTVTITRGGESWQEIYQVAATEPGDHRISCRSNDTGAFAVGEVPDTGKLVGGIAGGLIGLIGLPLTGILIGTVISVVVAVRRNNRRREIIARSYPPQY